MTDSTNTEISPAAQAKVDDHAHLMTELNEAQCVAIAREILAARIVAEGRRGGQFITRREALEAVCQAEVQAVEAGAKADVFFINDIDLEIPFGVA